VGHHQAARATTRVYFDLILDIFSRYVVGWTVAAREDSAIAKELMEHAMGVQGIPDVIHADRGTSMTSKPVAQLLVDLTVTRSHSRPRVSNDNPYSESAFKTLKYCRGTLALVGAAAAGTTVDFEIGQSLVKGWTFTTVLKGSSVPQDFIPRLINLWRAGQFPFDKLFTHYTLEDINQGLEDSKNGTTVKPVVRF